MPHEAFFGREMGERIWGAGTRKTPAVPCSEGHLQLTESVS